MHLSALTAHLAEKACRLPHAGGDGLPFYLHAIHAALGHAATASPVGDAAWTTHALALSICAAEGQAPDVLHQRIASAYGGGLAPEYLHLDDVAALGSHTATCSGLHALAAEAFKGIATHAASCRATTDTCVTKLVVALTFFAVL